MLSEVPPNSTGVGVPARIVRVNGVRVGSLDQIHVADPVSQEICRLDYELFTLKNELKEIKEKSKNQEQTEGKEEIKE